MPARLSRQPHTAFAIALCVISGCGAFADVLAPCGSFTSASSTTGRAGETITLSGRFPTANMALDFGGLAVLNSRTGFVGMTFIVPSAPPGLYDVAVINVDSDQQIGSFTFTVEP